MVEIDYLYCTSKQTYHLFCSECIYWQQAIFLEINSRRFFGVARDFNPRLTLPANASNLPLEHDSFKSNYRSQ